jgi:hypothetical protein
MPNIVTIDVKVNSDGASKAFAVLGTAGKAAGVAIAGSGLLSMAGPLGAAGVALGAFGALAAPTLKKVETALTTTGTAGKKAWAALDPAEKGIAQNIRGLETNFDGLAKAFEPVVASVVQLSTRMLGDLFPAISKLAPVGAKLISDFLGPFDTFLKSPFFASFVKQFGQLATTVGPSLGATLTQITKALLNLLVQVGPNGVKVFQQLGPLLVTLINNGVTPLVVALSGVFGWLLKLANQKPLILALFGAIALGVGLATGGLSLIIPGLVALVAGLKTAYNSSATFRDVVKTIGTVLLQVGIVVVTVNRDIINAFLSMASAVIHGAAAAFGWVPGLGSKLRGAATAFDSFKAGVNNGFNSMISSMKGWQGELGNSTNKATTATRIISGDFGKQLIATNASSKGVNTLAAAIGALHGKTVTVGANATASGTISIVGSGWAAGSGNIRFHAAQGAYVNSGAGPTADDNLAAVSRGELIVPAHMVAAGAADNLRGKIPGFAAGGIVGMPAAAAGFAGGDAKSAVTTGVGEAMTAAKNAVLKAVEASISAAGSAGPPGTAGPGGGAPAANAALARKMYPAWGSGPQWAAWNAVAMRESGWSQYARNASSGAYGIPQALPPSKMGAAANPPQSNPAAQISWMIGYIKGRYGTPEGAEAHEQSAGWYASGGATRAGWAMLGERGRELVKVPGGATVYPAGASAQMAAGSGMAAALVQLEVSGGQSDFDKFMAQWMKNFVRVKGGGDVQKAFGRN